VSGATELTAALLRGLPLPQLGPESDKEQRGRGLVIAGSREVPGGALLAGIAALRAGAGKLQIATAASIALALGVAMPEALVVALRELDSGGFDPEVAGELFERANRCGAVLIGPGMLDDGAVTELTRRLLEGVDGPAFVLDAAVLPRLPECRDALRAQAGRAIVTPHAGEMAALLDMRREDVVADPLGTARAAAAMLQSVIVLKGAATHIVTPQGEGYAFHGGHIGLATSGSGDTLAGTIAGLLARCATPLRAALWGVYLHGEAGNRLARSCGPLGFLAREIPGEIPRIMAEFSSSETA
jgi:ADP-dependent NAD(P)H-hydrate dehydratase